MKRTGRSTKKGPQLLRRGCKDPFAGFPPDPISVRLYDLGPLGEPVHLAMLAPQERNLAHVVTRYGPGLYQIVARYRGGVTANQVFTIEG